MELMQQLDRGVKRQLPAALVLLLSLVAALPVGVEGYGVMAAALPLVAVFIAAVERPDLMTRPAVFVCGLCQDALTGTPLGMSALLFLGVREIAAAQRLELLRRGFWVQWGSYVLATVATSLFAWTIVSLSLARLMPIGLVMVQAAAGAALFPWCARACQPMLRALPTPD